MPRSILVVDDDRGMVETLCDILELHGWRPLRAYDGAEAVAISASLETDVVLMDVQMPRTDGVAALLELKANRPRLPVILITAVATPEILIQARRGGAFSVLQKPLNLPMLLDALDGAVAA